jgi:hypothetical protein
LSFWSSKNLANGIGVLDFQGKAEGLTGVA